MKNRKQWLGPIVSWRARGMFRDYRRRLPIRQSRLKRKGGD